MAAAEWAQRQGTAVLLRSGRRPARSARAKTTRHSSAQASSRHRTRSAGSRDSAARRHSQASRSAYDRGHSALTYRLQQMLGGAGGENAQAGGNPFAALSQLGGGGAGAPPADSRPPEERYATQLEQLNGMGFHDSQANIRALRLSGGNVEGAVGILLD